MYNKSTYSVSLREAFSLVSVSEVTRGNTGTLVTETARCGSLHSANARAPFTERSGLLAPLAATGSLALTWAKLRMG